MVEFVPIHINCGGNAFEDNDGIMWQADQYFNIGAKSKTSESIEGADDPRVYQSNRWDNVASKPLIYDIPVPEGFYQVTLYFAETADFLFRDDARVFAVSMEGDIVFDNVDIHKESGGPYRPLKKTKAVSVTDGSLTIEFINQKQNPTVSGIEVRIAVPTSAPSVSPSTEPSLAPSDLPSVLPSEMPSSLPSLGPSSNCQVCFRPRHQRRNHQMCRVKNLLWSRVQIRHRCLRRCHLTIPARCLPVTLQVTQLWHHPINRGTFMTCLGMYVDLSGPVVASSDRLVRSFFLCYRPQVRYHPQNRVRLLQATRL